MLVTLSIFHRSHKESEKTIKNLLEADGAGQKAKPEPCMKAIFFLYQRNVLIYTNMKLT